jgi:hypothetical protein
LTVYVLAVSHPQYQNEEHRVLNLIDGTIVLPGSDAYAVELLPGFELLQAQEVAVDLLSDVRIEPAKVSLRGGSGFNTVGRNSVPELAHEFTKGNRTLLLRLFQCCAGAFEVDSVHLLAGKAFQQAEVFDGDNGSQVFPTTGYDGPLFAEGSAVDEIGELLPRFRDIETCYSVVYGSYKRYEFITSIGEKGPSRNSAARKEPCRAEERSACSSRKQRHEPTSWQLCSGVRELLCHLT